MKTSTALATLSLAGLSSLTHAAEVTLEIEIPRLEVAEYHRPYVAAWIEDENKSHRQNLLVWYQTEARGNPEAANSEKGEKWLKDLRKWWRTSGRELTMPVDGVSSPTKPPGKHRINLGKAFQDLPKGTYTLVVEASREVGGRELLSLPFTWDGTTLTAENAKGKSELGTITLQQSNK